MNEISFNTKGFQNAIAKAINQKPKVKIGKKDGQYHVAASSGFSSYTVQFQTSASGRRLASCLCAGGQQGFFCYHKAAALIAHSAFVRSGLRRPAARREVSAFAWRGSDAVRCLV